MIDKAKSSRTAQVSRHARKVSGLCVVIFNEINRTRVPVIGAAVAFFMLLALVPLLMVASALLGLLPIPNLFQQLLDMMAMLVPPDSLAFVKALLLSIKTPNAGRILSFGILSYLWAASGCFSSLIDALNIAYDVKVSRPWWRDRVQALLLTFTSGTLALVSLLCIVAGPHFAHLLSYLVPIPDQLTILWPPLRVSVILASFVLNIELLYYFAPNRRSTLRSSLPGAALAVGIWFLGSTLLSYYLEHLTNYSATYGSLGAIIGLMFWLYLTSVSILVGAELNAELAKKQARQAQSSGSGQSGAPAGGQPSGQLNAASSPAPGPGFPAPSKTGLPAA